MVIHGDKGVVENKIMVFLSITKFLTYKIFKNLHYISILIFKIIKNIFLYFDKLVNRLEPWGVLFAVLALFITIDTYQKDRKDRIEEMKARAEDRINLAISQFADGIGRQSAWNILRQYDVDLRSLEMPSAYLPGADLSNQDLVRVNLNEAYLVESDLGGSNLSRANLQNANLEDADLENVDLKYANLNGANLSFANLSNADIRFASLQNVNLQGATLENTNHLLTNLEGAHFCRTTMSDGTSRNGDCTPFGMRDFEAELQRWKY